MQATASFVFSLTLAGALACSSTSAGPATSPGIAGNGSGASSGTANGGGGSSNAAGGANPGGTNPNPGGTNPGMSGNPSGGSVAGGDDAGIGGGGGGGGAGGGPGGGADTGSGGGSAGPVYPPIEECANTPSVDRLTQWTASGEGTTVPATGSILVKQGNDYVGKVQFVGAEWHVVPVLLTNKFGVAVDLTSSSGFTLTYSATADLHMQLRTKSHWGGGDQYATDIPSTGGMVQTKTFSFAEANWKSLFGAPVLSYADTLKDAMGLVFVGNSENTLIVSGLRIGGVIPPCQ
ncbi:MAG TPA: hypothetical protein VHB79_30025 [Polyangiaceae bacterium]|nr:hypothetical protein [Polyangiaceae bacterium]